VSEVQHRTASATWWRSLGAALLLLGALLAVYVVVGDVLGAGSERLSLSWQNLVSLGCAGAVAVPLWRWLRDRMHDLADSFPESYLAVTALSSTAPSGATVDTASVIAKALHLPWVEVELDGSASFGHPSAGAAVTVVPVHYRGETYGAIRVAERRPGSGLTRSDTDLLLELADQLALRVAAERAVDTIAESRTEIVAAREEERVRIRRDLHDGLAPSLAAVQLQLTALQRGLPADDIRRETVTELIDQLRGASADLRRLVYDLRPPLLDEAGLRGALEQQFATITEPTVRLQVQDGPLPAAVEVAVLRIAGEAVVNAVKHAGASIIDVTMEAAESSVRLTITDDGIGLATPAIPGVGLSSMRQRAEELGGTLDVESGAGSGTRVVATIGWTS
jgi:two-component system NarL family sensor kinase